MRGIYRIAACAEKTIRLIGGVHETMEPLLQSLSPEQKELFLQYEAAAGACAVSISERAYKNGARLVVRVLAAGCADHKGAAARSSRRYSPAK